MKRSITINPGVLNDLIEKETTEENELRLTDEVELVELQQKNKSDDHKEAWDEVVEKKEEENEEEEKERVVEQVENERLPRVAKPVGDVLTDLLKLDIGEDNVFTLLNLDLKEVEQLIMSCISRVRME